MQTVKSKPNYVYFEGRKVNLDTAELIAENSYGSTSDFHFVREKLYRTPRGNFFVHGRGGAASKYGRKVDTNSWVGGEEYRFVDEAEAKRLAVEWGADPKALERFFEIEEA